MTYQYEFKIDNKFFRLSSEFLKKDKFDIKSNPKNYEVVWDKDSIQQTFEELATDKSNYLFIDKNVFDSHFHNVDLHGAKVFTGEATENFKTIDGVLSLVDFLASNRFTKGERLLVVGGGIIQDVGAFAGACYKRGIDWTLFPTTSLAMTDSCIGAKTGINYNGAKNQLGLFSAPSKVVVKPQFLNTLNKDDLISGLGESLKLYTIAGTDALKYYVENYKSAITLDPTALRTVILGALKIKKAVIEEDEFDLGYRNSLNYGHTIGHAIEVLSNYKITHGQAVVIGMLIVNEMSQKRGLLAKDKNNFLKKLCLDLLNEDIIKVLRNLDFSKLHELIRKDKKTKGGITKFVFIKDIGEVVFVPLKLTNDLVAEIVDITKEVTV